MSFGLTSAGFSAKRLADVLQELRDAFRNGIGQNVDLSNDGPWGQVVGIESDREALVWELLDLLWLATSADSASGFALDRILSLCGMQRLPAAPTAAQVTLSGTPGTVVPQGFLLNTNDTGIQFASTAAATIGGGGTVVQEFDCVSSGPTLCLAGTLTTIVSPLAGLTSATNLLDGAVGRSPETDALFRARRRKAFATVLSSTNPGLTGRLLAVAGVLETKILENRTAGPDAAGRPANCFEAVVRGGADADVLAAVWAGKPAGIQTFGNVSGTVLDARGDPHVLSFSRPTIVPVYCRVNATARPGFPANGESQIQAAVLTYGASLLISQEVDPYAIQTACDRIPGIAELDVYLGRSPTPTSIAPLPIGFVELAALDSTRLTVRRI